MSPLSFAVCANPGSKGDASILPVSRAATRLRLLSDLDDRDLVASRIQAKLLQRHFSRQMTAGAKGADGDSFPLQIRRLA